MNNRESLKFISPHDLGVVVDHIANNEEIQQNAYKKNWGIEGDNQSVNRNDSFPFLRKQSKGRCFSCQSSEHYADNPICPNYMSRNLEGGNFGRNFNESPNAYTQNQQNKQAISKQNGNRNLANSNNQGMQNSGNNTPGGRGQEFTCTFCGKSGHTAIHCVLKRRGDICVHCGRDNHTSSNCRRKNHSVNRVQATFCSNELMQGDTAFQETNSCRFDNNNEEVIDVEKLLALSNEHELLSKQDFKVDFIQSDRDQCGDTVHVLCGMK